MSRRPQSTGLTLWIGRAGYPGSMSLNESSQDRKHPTWTFVPDRRSVAGGWSVGGWHAGDPAGDARSQGRSKLQAQLFRLYFGSCVRQCPAGVCQRLEGQPGPHSCISALMEDGKPSVWFSSVAQSCLTLCDPMDCSTPGLPVHWQLLEFIQTRVH